MHLVVSPDEKYAEHAAVMLASVFASLAEPRGMTVWVVANGLGARSRGLLARVVEDGGGKVEFLAVDVARLKDAPVSGHFSSAGYYRLLVFPHLPADVERFLYLDSDLVVEDDIGPLFEVDLEGKVLAAVGNFCQWHEQIGLAPDTRYFNSGVLMIDRRRWETERVSERALAMIAEKGGALRFWDQDALNSVIAGRWTSFAPAWNQQHYFPELDTGLPGYEAGAWQEALERPRLIHFTGGLKPWHAKSRHPFRARYHHYRRRAGLSPLWSRPSHLAEAWRRIWRGWGRS